MEKPAAGLAAEIEQQLLKQYGPLLGGSLLQRALGFKSAAALRQAVQRDQVGVQLFAIANRRGKFALTRDVARWLAKCSSSGDGYMVADRRQLRPKPAEADIDRGQPTEPASDRHARTALVTDTGLS